MTLDLLVLAPHPDDAELCCGGLLALAAQRGQRAGIADLSAGELATNGTPAIRRREAAAAAEVLQLATRVNLGLPDGALDPTDRDQVDAVVAALRTHRPALLLAPWTEARHPDHEATGTIARKAVFLAGLVNHRPDLGDPFRPTRLLHYPMRVEVRPDLVVDTSAVWETKRKAIACHASQLGGKAATLISDPVGGGEAFAVRDRYWGASIGVAHGEPYILGAPVPISDPVAHFGAHPDTPALVPPR